MTERTYQIGFKSQENQLQTHRVPVDGALPSWLSGTLLRNCPSKFDFPSGPPVKHWFDGLSMLHAITVRNGEATYSSKFLRTNAFSRSQATGAWCLRGFATDPPMNLWQRTAAIFNPQLTDNANVNVARFDNRFVALTETSTVTEFQLETLETLGEFHFDDRLAGQITTAHPQFDIATGSLFNVLVKLGKQSKYQIYRMDSGSRRRKLLAEIPVANPSYIHSFAMTPRYLVLTEFPLRLNPLKFLFSGKPYIDNFAWQPGGGTSLHVIDKADGKLVATFSANACFAFHHVNAFEDGNKLSVDALVYADASVIQALRLGNLREDKAVVPAAELKRFTMDLAAKTVAIEKLCDAQGELPRINQDTCSGIRYKNAFLVGSSSPNNFLDHLVKINTENGNFTTWREDNTYPGEPVFVARPGAHREDDGVILSLVLDAPAARSFMLVLDGQTFDELARIQLPHVVAFGFHGDFFRDSK